MKPFQVINMLRYGGWKEAGSLLSEIKESFKGSGAILYGIHLAARACTCIKAR